MDHRTTVKIGSLENFQLYGIKAMLFMMMGKACSESSRAGVLVPIPIFPLYNAVLTELVWRLHGEISTMHYVVCYQNPCFFLWIFALTLTYCKLAEISTATYMLLCHA